jgi:hypothetical protein
VCGHGWLMIPELDEESGKVGESNEESMKSR